MPTSLGNISFALDYLTKDFEGYRQGMLNTATSILPEWTNIAAQDMGVIIIESVSGQLDVGSYYVDRIYNEAYLDTAILYKSLLYVAKMLGYTPRPRVASLVTQNITIKPLVGAATLIAGHRFSTQKSGATPGIIQEFTLNSDLSLAISPVAITYSATLIQGEIITNRTLGSGSGKPFQILYLPHTDYCHHPLTGETLVVETEDPTAPGTWLTWTIVDGFYNSLSSDRHIKFQLDENERWYIQCGSGVDGEKFPVGTNNIRASYRRGGGNASLYVGKNEITRDVEGSSVIQSTTNPASPILGNDAESLQELRINVPGQVKAIDTLARVEHYEAFVTADGNFLVNGVEGPQKYQISLYVFPQPEDVYSYLENVENAASYLRAMNGIPNAYAFINSSGINPYDPFSRADYDLVRFLTSGLLSRINAKKVQHSSVLFKPAWMVDVYATYNVILSDSVLWSKAQKIIYSKLAYAILNGDIPFEIGRDLRTRDVDLAIEDVANGILQVDIMQFQRVPYARPLSVSGGFTGAFETLDSTYRNGSDEYWKLKYIGNNEVAVIKNDVHVATVSHDAGTQTVAELSFSTSNIGVLPCYGDTLEIRVGSYRGNIAVDPFELVNVLANQSTFVFEGGINDL